MNIQAYTIHDHPEWACIHLKALEKPDQARTPVHLSCVLDTSGSMMTDQKLENVKQSLTFLLDFLGPEDQLSIVVFSDQARTILERTMTTLTNKEHIRTQISFIQANGNTNLSAGLVEARDALLLNSDSVKQGMLVLTDGHANRGTTRSSDLVELVRATMRKYTGTSISCIGYGTDHNASLLQQISAEGGGAYYIVNNAEDVAVVFGNVLGGLMSCTYQQVQLTFPAGTELKTRYPTNGTSDGLRVAIGDLPAGMEAVVLAKMSQGQGLRLGAFDLGVHDSLNVPVVIVDSDNEELQVNGHAHYLRLHVVDLLEETVCISGMGSLAAKAEQRVKLQTCITSIQQYMVRHPHSLWDILIQQLQNGQTTLDHHDHESDITMTQNYACLAMMRGASTPAAADANANANGHSYAAPGHVASPYANHVQREISAQLQRTMSQRHDDSQPGLPYAPSSQ